MVAVHTALHQIDTIYSLVRRPVKAQERNESKFSNIKFLQFSKGYKYYVKFI